MIRSVVLCRLRPGADPALLDAALRSLDGVRTEGMLAFDNGRDLDLRDGTWDAAITADFVDEQAYRRYDLDEEHNRVRRELFAPACGEIARVQFHVADVPRRS